MVKLDQIIESWKIDCKIDESNPQQELIKTPLLFSFMIIVLSFDNMGKASIWWCLDRASIFSLISVLLSML